MRKPISMLITNASLLEYEMASLTYVDFLYIGNTTGAIYLITFALTWLSCMKIVHIECQRHDQHHKNSVKKNEKKHDNA